MTCGTKLLKCDMDADEEMRTRKRVGWAIGAVLEDLRMKTGHVPNIEVSKRWYGITVGVVADNSIKTVRFVVTIDLVVSNVCRFAIKVEGSPAPRFEIPSTVWSELGEDSAFEGEFRQSVQRKLDEG